MLKLHQLFFINFFFIFSGTFIIAGAISFYTIQKIELESHKKQLEKLIYVLESNLDFRQLNETLRILHPNIETYITVFDEKGGIIASSYDSPNRDMKFFNAFPELKTAAQNTFGTGMHFDKDIGQEMLFVAKKITLNQKNVYIRAGIESNRILSEFQSLWINLIVIFMFSIVIGLLVARAINENIKSEIDRILEYLKDISDKNYKSRPKMAFTREFDTLSQQLKRVAKKLEKREKKIRKYTASLRLRNRQNNEIISAISHEFKNPVAVVVGYSETLLDDDNMNENIRKRFLKKIYDNGQKITSLIDRLTLSIKLENKAMEPKLSTFNVYDICSEAVSTVNEKHKNRHVVIHGQTRLIEADKTLIEIVLINLVENAIKYSEDKVEIDITPNAIRVIDHGIGISENDLKNITKKFYRVDKNTWDSSLGLGLAIVKYILRLHDTYLQIDSEPGKGSVFWFEI